MSMSLERAAIVCLDLAENSEAITLEQSDAIHVLLDSLTAMDHRITLLRKEVDSLQLKEAKVI